MTKEPDKCNWLNNYNNKALSGIEIREKSGKLVNFITIKHDEVLEKKASHRIAIKISEDGKPILPPAQTFEEIIQAKRRHQMLLYGSGNSSSATIISDRTARRVAARPPVSATNLSRRSHRPARISRRPSASRSRSSRSRSRRKITKPEPTTIQEEDGDDVGEGDGEEADGEEVEPQNNNNNSNNGQFESVNVAHQPKATEPVREPTPAPTPASEPTTTAPPTTSVYATAAGPIMLSNDPIPSTSGPVVTSMRELYKHNPLFSSVDPKEVKLLLKTAAPGASIILPNGTVIKKSRRGGARAGAGRKRSRPLPGAQQTSPPRQSASIQQAISTNNSSSVPSQA